MAPEQFDGHAGDQRADIFAFGCVLYEMLAGRKAFDGVNFMKVIAAIKSSEPPPNERIRGAHPMLDHILRRCFEKDPDAAGRASATYRRAAVGARESCARHPPLPPPPANRRGAGRGAARAGRRVRRCGRVRRRCGPAARPRACRRCSFEIPTPPTDERRWRCRPTDADRIRREQRARRRCCGCARSTASRAGCSRARKAPAIRSGRRMGARSVSSPTTS